MSLSEHLPCEYMEVLELQPVPAVENKLGEQFKASQLRLDQFIQCTCLAVSFEYVFEKWIKMGSFFM